MDRLKLQGIDLGDHIFTVEQAHDALVAFLGGRNHA